jgi:hypothetical protein
VTGPGSHWNLEASLSLSSFGSGTLNINDGGLVTVGENVESPFTSIGSNSKVNLDGGRFEFGITSFESLSRICGTRGSLAGKTESISGYRQISSLEIGNLSSLDTTDVRVANAGVILGTGVTNLGLENDTDGELRAMATDFMKIEGHSFNSGEINNFGGVIEFENSLTNRADGFIGGRGQFSTDGGLINEGVMAFTAGPTEISGDVEILAGGRVITSGGSVTTFFNDLAHNGQEIRTAAGSRTKFLGEVSGAGAFTGTGELLIMGDLRPGNSPGMMRFEGDLTLTQSANSFFEIGGRGEGQFDQLIVAGQLHLDGSLSVSLFDGFELAIDDEFLIADVAGVLSGQFDGLNQGDRVSSFSGIALSISYIMGDGNDVGLYATAVPEPGVILFLLMGMGGLSFRRYR